MQNEQNNHPTIHQSSDPGIQQSPLTDSLTHSLTDSASTPISASQHVSVHAAPKQGDGGSAFPTESSIQKLESSNQPPLELFTQSAILEQIGSTRINRFIAGFWKELNAVGITPPEPGAENGHYFSSAAALFAGNHLPERVRSTLHTLEQAASPQNEDRLDIMIAEHLPHLSLAGRSYLDRALELWFASPDSLSQFATPSAVASSPSSSSIECPASSIQHPGSSTSESSNQHPVTSIQTHPSNLPSPISHLPSPLSSLPSSLSVLSHPDSTPWPEPVDAKQLLDTLAALASKHVILPQYVADAIALYIPHTYAFKLRDISAYLGIESPLKRCGKTTLLSFLGELVHRPIPAANVSPSALF